MWWSANAPSSNAWGDLSQDMTSCPDGSTPKPVQQHGAFNNLTACANYVNAIESSNLFTYHHQKNELQQHYSAAVLLKNQTKTPERKDKGKDDDDDDDDDDVTTTTDYSCSDYSSSVDPTTIKSSCLLPISDMSALAYEKKSVILSKEYCPGSHVEVYNTASSQNYSAYNLQVVMLSCNNVVVVSYRGTVFGKYYLNHVLKQIEEEEKEEKEEKQEEDKEDSLFGANIWNAMLDMAAWQDAWVIPLSSGAARRSNTIGNSTFGSNVTIDKNGRATAWVHHGFKVSVQAVNSAVRSFLSKYYTKSKSRLIVTGHSLGGAMATLGAYDLHHGVDGVKYPVTLAVTFGAPRSLSGAWFDSTSNVRYDVPTLRVTHHRDVVPQVPPKFSTLYHHVPRELYLGEDCCYSNACNGSGEDTSCGNSGFNVVWSVLWGGIPDHSITSGYQHALGR